MSNPSSPSGATEASLRPGRLLLVAGLGFGLAALLLTWNCWVALRLLHESRLGSRERDFWTLCQTGSTVADRTVAFRRLVNAGHTEWRSANLTQLNLSNAQLAGKALAYANFQKTVFEAANLEKTSLTHSSFELADLQRASLNLADCSEAQFYRASLARAHCQ